MRKDHDHRKGASSSARVSEPVQVYLAPAERARLDRLTTELSASKSDVIRRGLEALGQQLTVPGANPVLKLIGMVQQELPSVPTADVGRDHDPLLDQGERDSWKTNSR